MKITKLGHCCLLIEENNLRILTDPGEWTIEEIKPVKNLDLLLITHEHYDHLHVPSVKQIIANNPHLKVITNFAVGKLLEPEGVAYEVVDDGKTYDFKGLQLRGFGKEHAEIYPTWRPVENTGYFIGERLFYPGDAFTIPTNNGEQLAVELLALPVGGPWLKIEEAVDYALKIKPRLVFPVHDGMFKNPGGSYFVPQRILPENKIEFRPLDLGKEYQL